MGLAQRQPQYTEAEYLAWEREADTRHEYLDGEIYAMAGESEEHGIISMNLALELGNRLRESACQPFSKDMKVRSGPAPQNKFEPRGFYSYPDLVVVCGQRLFHDDHKDVLLNPTVIIEVLSPSTANFDRTEKFYRYRRWNATLQEYILVAQDRPLIEHHIRQADSGWTSYLFSELTAEIFLPALNCTIRLQEIYRNIEFK